ISTEVNYNLWVPPNPRPVPPPPPPVQKRGYTVVPGDCLWYIAEEQLGDPYRWPEIYEMNRDVIGGNPDLIYPGQVYTLP
ncbi:MAG: LysM peptidoglycan-binding domain-containing protein, partial [Bacteroidales bacterium]